MLRDINMTKHRYPIILIKISFLFGLLILIASCSDLNKSTYAISKSVGTLPPSPTSLPSATATLAYSVIDRTNADMLHLIGRIGNGVPRNVAWSRNGSRFAVATSIGIYIYESEGRTLIRFLPIDTVLTSMAISPDGSMVAGAVCVDSVYFPISCNNATISIWDVPSGESIIQIPYSPGLPYSLAFSPDGSILASGGCGRVEPTYLECLEGKIILWDIKSGKQLRELNGHSNKIVSIDFSSDGTMLVSGGYDSNILIWSTSGEQYRLLMTGCDQPIWDVAFSPDGRTIAAGTCQQANIYDIQSGYITAKLRGDQDGMVAVSYSPDSKHLATGGNSQDSKVTYWEIESSQPIFTTELLGGDIVSLDISPDGETIVFAAEDGGVGLLDVDTGEAIDYFTSSWHYRSAIAFNNTGTRMAIASADGSVEEWEPHSLGLLVKYPSFLGHIGSLAYRTSDQLVSITCTDSELRLMDARTGEILRTHTTPYSLCGWNSGLTINHTGTFAAMTTGSRGFTLWNLTTGELNTFNEPFGTQALVFTEDDQFIAALSMYGIVFLWDMEGNKILQTNSMPEGQRDYGNMGCLALSIDASQYAWAGYDIGVGDLEEDSEPIEFRLAGDQNDFVRANAINTIGDLLAVAIDSDRKALALFDLSSGTRLDTLFGHTGTIRRVVFSPDGTLLVDVSDDGTILLWSIH